MTNRVEIYQDGETDEWFVTVVGDAADDWDGFSTMCEQEAKAEAEGYAYELNCSVVII
jgi:hypothetical protein